MTCDLAVKARVMRFPPATANKPAGAQSYIGAVPPQYDPNRRRHHVRKRSWIPQKELSIFLGLFWPLKSKRPARIGDYNRVRLKIVDNARMNTSDTRFVVLQQQYRGSGLSDGIAFVSDHAGTIHIHLGDTSLME